MLRVFTGIIQQVATITKSTPQGSALRLMLATNVALDVSIGDSVAVNGVCLTVEQINGVLLTMTAVRETLERTTTGFLRAGVRVNIELALRVGDRLGGHFVQGHIDAVGHVVSIIDDIWTVRFPRDQAAYICEKGSIALNGVSLTVRSKQDDTLTVAIIPHTLKHTTFETMNIGSAVNIEVDILAKYVAEASTCFGRESLTERRLKEMGY